MSTLLAGTGRDGPPRRRETTRRWYRLAAAIAAAGLLAALGWGAAGIRTAVAAPRSFARAAVPGATAVTLPAGTSRVVYYEGQNAQRAPAPSALGLTVTDPAGRAVPLAPYGRNVRYDAPRRGVLGSAVATFRTGEAGTYRVAAGGTLPGDSRIAVGPDIGRAVAERLLGPALLALLALGTAGAMGAAGARRQAG